MISSIDTSTASPLILTRLNKAIVTHTTTAPEFSSNQDFNQG